VKSFKFEFDGGSLKRGFWIYIFEAKLGKKRYFYVGRTGDNSTPNAASPFTRVSRHLDSSPNAQANSFYKRLREIKVAPEDCTYRFVSFGPIFPEQSGDFGEHVPYRDRTARLERALADWVKEREYDVLGRHPKKGALGTDDKIFEEAKKHFIRQLGL
jgi:hypothetical protein